MDKIKLQRHLAYKREARRRYAKRYPEKIRARWLVGDAIRYKLMKPPIADRNWHNTYQFHHPDHSRPYYGCWLTTKEHGKVERGEMPCPPCVDYSIDVLRGVLNKWGLTAFLKLKEGERD